MSSSCERLPENYVINEIGNRGAADPQPLVVERPNATSREANATDRWACMASVAKKQTGKASKWTLEKAGPFRGAAQADATSKRDAFVRDYMNPKTTSAATTKRTRSNMEGMASQASEGAGHRAKRAAAPCSFMLESAQRQRGPKPGQGIAGPGRGHKNAMIHASSVVELPNLPLPANWLERHAVQKRWQTRAIEQLQERTRQLEAQLMERDEVIQRQDAMIMQLREKVCTSG